MQLSNNTKTILKNFASINPGIVIFPGKTLRTIAVDKTIVAEAEVEETFDREIPIYNVNEFLSVVGLFNSPDLSFEEGYVLISEGKSKQKYWYSNKGNIEHKTTAMPTLEYNLNFDLTREELNRINRAASVNNATHVVIENDKTENLKVTVTEVDKQSGEMSKKFNVFELNFEDVKFDTNFKLMIDKSMLKVVDQNYAVFLYFKDGKKLVHFESDVVKYFIAVEAYSTVED